MLVDLVYFFCYHFVDMFSSVYMLIGMGFPDVHMLGLYGIGGIGKSTIGKAIYNSISCKFDGISFLTC